jgi:hypothetical protein
MKTSHIGRAGILALTIAAASCSAAVREGTGSSFLIISNLQAASGAEPDELDNTLRSDVLTIVDGSPSIFNDSGSVTFLLGLKDPGSAQAPITPTQNQFITINRYRVRYLRADGRNTPGVDVPYGFDGSVTVTVGADGGSAAFQIVRHIAKQEAPLASLAFSPVIISTIAEVTFFGHDQNGREVSATGNISIDFGNFADPSGS